MRTDLACRNPRQRQRLYNQAAEIAARSTANGSDQRLYNQAAEIAA